MANTELISLFNGIQNGLEENLLSDIYLKPKQLKALELLYRRKDVMAVFPTGYGKSLIFQLLPFLHAENKNAKVIVVSPLNSIITDQMTTLKSRGIQAGVLPNFQVTGKINYLFSKNIKKETLSQDIITGSLKFLFAHPESLVSDEGRKILKSEPYGRNVVAVIIDEAHCVELW